MILFFSDIVGRVSVFCVVPLGTGGGRAEAFSAAGGVHGGRFFPAKSGNAADTAGTALQNYEEIGKLCTYLHLSWCTKTFFYCLSLFFYQYVAIGFLLYCKKKCHKTDTLLGTLRTRLMAVFKKSAAEYFFSAVLFPESAVLFFENAALCGHYAVDSAAVIVREVSKDAVSSGISLTQQMVCRYLRWGYLRGQVDKDGHSVSDQRIDDQPVCLVHDGGVQG